MKKILTILCLAVIFIFQVGCGGAENTLTGKFLMSEISFEGETIIYPDLAFMEAEGDYIEFFEDGSMEFWLLSEKAPDPKVDFENNTIDVMGEVIDFTINDDVMTVTYLEMSFVFVKEDSAKWEDIKAQESIILGDLSDMFTDYETSSDELNYEALETTEFLVNSEWYGYVSISDYIGPENALEEFGIKGNGMYDAFGYFAYDEIAQKDYFEFFVGELPESYPLVSLRDAFYSEEYPQAIASYYTTELMSDYFEPIVDEDAWIFYDLIDVDSAWGLSPFMIDGELYADYYYDYDGVSLHLELYLREIGSLWASYDILPPSYDEYVTGENALVPSDMANQSYNNYKEEEASSKTISPYTKAELKEYVESFDYTGKTLDDLIAHFDGVLPYVDYYNEEVTYYRYSPNDDDYAYVDYLVYYEDGVEVIRGETSEGIK